MGRKRTTFKEVEQRVLAAAKIREQQPSGEIWSAVHIQHIGWPEEQGFRTTALGIGAALKRLVHVGRIERMSQGWYRLARPKD